MSDSNGKNAPTLHYAYVHLGLRSFIFKEQEFFTKVFYAGPRNMSGFLRQFWDNLREDHQELNERDIEVLEDDFSLSVSKLTNGEDLLLIKLPRPNNSPEAFYIGVVISKGLRYFTLELGKDIFNGNSDTFVVCEWKEDGQHMNYGEISEMRPGLFAGRIDEIVKG